MELERIAATYSILAGIALMVFWVMVYRKKDLTEITMEPVAFMFHIGSDILTSILLIVGGVSILGAQLWGYPIYFISMGLLIYSLLNFSGYYGQQKDWPRFGLFILLAIVAILFTLLMLLT